jgi:hypothetical protein
MLITRSYKRAMKERLDLTVSEKFEKQARERAKTAMLNFRSLRGSDRERGGTRENAKGKKGERELEVETHR